VFPIPSGKTVTTSKIDPATGKPVTVNVPGFFKMRSRFVDYSGYYVIHCHILAHEDRGMMTVVEVSPAPLPYSHN
jgi:FtsP/CotA-like multicopper oxidase with cupredoxin domain